MQFGPIGRYNSITEPSSFARLRRADSEMKHVKNKDFSDMFLRRSGSDRVQLRDLNRRQNQFSCDLSDANWTRSLPLLGSVIEWQRLSHANCASTA